MSDIAKARIVTALLFILLVVIMPHSLMQLDKMCWQDWAVYIHLHGLAHAYDNPMINYHPVYLYMIYLYDLLQGSELLIRENIYQLKYVFLVFDFLPVIVLCCLRQNTVKERIPYLFLLLNIAYLFNTVIWGQLDCIHTNLVFLSLLFAGRKPTLGAALFTLAFFTKLQAIIFLPVLCCILFYSIRDVKQLVTTLFTVFVISIVILLPFEVTGTTQKFFHVVTHGVGFYHNLILGAYNMWQLLFKDAYKMTDTGTFLGLSYMQIGLAIFLLLSALTLLPLFARSLKKRTEKSDGYDDTLKLIMLTCALITLYFFYFNTQMHERYSHPMVIFLFFYGVFSKNYKLYVLASIPYLLSLDKCYPNYFPTPHYKIIFAARAIAGWYTLALAYTMYEFFRQYNLKVAMREIRSLLIKTSRN